MSLILCFDGILLFTITVVDGLWSCILLQLIDWKMHVFVVGKN
jgi:hypothetical protein